MKKLIAIGLTFSLFLAAALPARAGGALEEIDITGREPLGGGLRARLVPIEWDARTLPVRYSVNNTLSPVPNPLGESFLSLEQATAALQSSFDAWNNIPTSYIDMRIVNQTGNTGFVGFDMVNELSFRTGNNFGAIASSPSVSLIEDEQLVDGDRLDNDADADVSGAITVAADVDGDGDIEFPAGFYRAGTILDNDVQFNTKTSNGLRFTVDPTPPDNVGRSVDLQVVATHEFGHSHGLAHSLIDQTNATNGDGATMFPFIDTGDPVAETIQRELAIDDIAYSSFYYQEGSDDSGPAALQRGDTAFNRAYGLIRGSLFHGELQEPVLGGSLFAVNSRTKSVIANAYSGTAVLAFNPNTGALSLNRAFSIVNGDYVLPVPRGNYNVGVEALDGEPAAAGNIGLTPQVGSILGQQNFIEEFYDYTEAFGSVNPDNYAVSPGLSTPVSVRAGRPTDGVSIVTDRVRRIQNFGSLNTIGFNTAPGTYYAVQIFADQISPIASDALSVQGAAFHTFAFDSSTVPVYAEALLTTGTTEPVSGIAQIDLANPLARATNFVGQENDLTPFYFRDGRAVGRQIARGIRNGEIQNLFLVLRVPTQTPFPGVNALPPLIGLDGTPNAPNTNDSVIFGQSYLSTNGGASFVRDGRFNYRFSLILSLP